MIFKDLIYKNNKKYMFNASSRATSMEELGNGLYYEALNVLNKNKICIKDSILINDNDLKRSNSLLFILINER